MNPNTFELQKQIMENSKSINDYYKDLYDWEKDAIKKDKIIKTQNSTITNVNPKQLKREDESSNNSSSTSTGNTNIKLKRDINSIGEYYKEWDKVPEEYELEDVDSKITHNSDNSIAPMRNDIVNLKPSQAKANLNITIKNNRIGTGGSFTEDYIEKIKNEANAYFAIGNYNKSVEMNMSILKFIQGEEKNDSRKNYLIRKSLIYNNKGNCHLKLGNLKDAIKDFDFVIENDTTNVKALFRRGLCLYNLWKFHLALKDFHNAHELSGGNERGVIEEFRNNSISEINSMVGLKKRKMENFEFSENYKLKKIIVNEINSEIFKSQNNDYNNLSLRSYLNKENINDNNQQEKINKSETETKKNKKIIAPINMKNEDIVKFIYDITTENLTASSFKYAFRNFKNNNKEKEEYLLKINPAYISKIFVNDLDREILNEIFTCLKGILTRNEIK